jgi:hypothetical protein
MCKSPNQTSFQLVVCLLHIRTRSLPYLEITNLSQSDHQSCIKMKCDVDGIGIGIHGLRQTDV